MTNDIGGVWRTVGGRRIFIKDGQPLSVAMKESGKFATISKKKLEETKKKQHLFDITQEWHGEESQLLKVELNDNFIYQNKEYLMDGHFVKYRLKEKENKFAEWISQKQKLKVRLNPEVEYPEGISVADCTIYNGNNELGHYDMKVVTGKSKQLVFHNVDKKKKQATKFLFEATNSPLSKEDLQIQIIEVFQRKATWVEEIGIKKDDEFVIYKNK